jgi:hypothetical protein
MTAHVFDGFGVTRDSTMTFLREALTPSIMTGALQEVLNTEVVLEKIEVKRYKPARRCLIAYTFHDGLTVLGKIRAKGLDKTSYETQTYFFEKNLPVPQLLGVVPNLNMWLQEYLAGVPLTDVLTTPHAPSLVREVARQLYRLHGLPPLTSRRHSPEDELNILDDRLKRVAEQHPAWSTRLHKLFQTCEHLALGLPVANAKGIHRDFYADQVLVADARLYLLDFDVYALGDPALDVGNFLAHLTELALRSGNPDKFLGLERALESSYLALTSDSLGERIHVYKTLTLVRHIFISTQLEGRRAFTEGLLELCEHTVRNLLRVRLSP